MSERWLVYKYQIWNNIEVFLALAVGRLGTKSGCESRKGLARDHKGVRGGVSDT